MTARGDTPPQTGACGQTCPPGDFAPKRGGSASPDGLTAGRPRTRRRREGRVRAAAKLLAVTLLLALVPFVAGCGQFVPTMFRPESEGARHIQTLTFAIFGILTAIFVTVWILLFTTIIRDRKRPESEVKQTHGSMRLEAFWTLIPAIIVAILFYLTLNTTGNLALPSEEIRLAVTGHQWWWEVEYGSGEAAFRTANEIHLPAERGAVIELESADVIHSFWVPQMGGKVDTIPGHVNMISFLPTTPGAFVGQCAEFCGLQHAKMRFWLIVQTPQEFSAWYENEQQPAVAPQGEDAEAGADLIATLPCAGCHTIRGTNLQGPTGPDLTHFGSRNSIAAMSLTNTPENLVLWLQRTQQVKPGNKMPQVPLNEQQVNQLVAYLEGLK